jgi:ribosomal protein L16 Arg81 hydroxylase
MIDEILPELHANVEIIAREQVEVEHLRKEIYQAAENVAAQRYQVGLLRDRLTTQHVTYQVGSRTISRQRVVERLASRLDRFKQAKTVLTSKQRMLDVRDQALAAAEEMLDKTKIRKAQLEEKIEALVAQHRLIKAQAVASEVHIDNSKLARADRLMTEIQKRLETAQRVLAHEADFFADDVVEVFSEDELLAEVDAQLENGEFDVLAVLQDADELK